MKLEIMPPFIPISIREFIYQILQTQIFHFVEVYRYNFIKAELYI